MRRTVSPHLFRDGFGLAAAQPRLTGAITVLLLVAVITMALFGGAIRETAPFAVSDDEAGWTPGLADGLPYRPPEGVRSQPLGQWSLRLPDRVLIQHDFERPRDDSTALTYLLPGLNGDAALYVNGVPTDQKVAGAERYLTLRGSRPVVWEIPDHFVRPGLNRFSLVVTGAHHRALDAAPVLGPAQGVDRLYQASIRAIHVVRAGLPGLALIATVLALGAAMAVRSPIPWLALSAAAASVCARTLATDTTVAAALGPWSPVLDQAALSAALICLGCAFAGRISGPVRASPPWLAAGAVLLVLLLAIAFVGVRQGNDALEAGGLGLPVVGLVGLAAAGRQALGSPSNRPWRGRLVEGAGAGLLVLTSIAAVVGSLGLVRGVWVPAVDTVYGLGVVALLTGLAGASALLVGRTVWRWIRDRPRLSRIIRNQQQEIEAAALALRQQERRAATLEERQRMSRDMHDGIGGQLTSLLARVRSGKITPEETEGELRNGLAELRMMVDSLDASDGSVADALAVLRSRVRGQAEAAGMALTWNQSEALTGIAADPSWILNFSRVIQEAVTNAVRHSGGGRLTVDIELADGDRLRVGVTDDGVGFDRDTVRPGRGLANLAFRTTQLGGTIRFSRHEGRRGMVVEAMVAAPRPPIVSDGQSDSEMMPS